MWKKSINIMTACLIVMFVFGFSGCDNLSKEVSVDKTFENTIQEKLNNITHPKDPKILLSSNPYDCIKNGDGNVDYKYIVSQGKESLNFMLNKFDSSTNNGIEEYIMAIACSDILKESSTSKNWSSGREWYNNYLKQKG